jgi:hypothetical protein
MRTEAPYSLGYSEPLCFSGPTLAQFRLQFGTLTRPKYCATTVIQALPGHVPTAHLPPTSKPSSKLMTTNITPLTTLQKEYRSLYVEDFPDEQASLSHNTAPMLHIASFLTPGQPHYRTHNPRNATGPECRAMMVLTPLKSKP